MRWNIVLLMLTVVMLLLLIGVGFVEHMTQAEAIAEKLAPQIGVDEDVIRRNLEGLLRQGSVRRTVVYGSPLALLSVLLAGRLIADMVKKRRGGT